MKARIDQIITALQTQVKYLTTSVYEHRGLVLIGGPSPYESVEQKRKHEVHLQKKTDHEVSLRESVSSMAEMLANDDSELSKMLFRYFEIIGGPKPAQILSIGELIPELRHLAAKNNPISIDKEPKAKNGLTNSVSVAYQSYTQAIEESRCMTNPPIKDREIYDYIKNGLKDSPYDDGNPIPSYI